MPAITVWKCPETGEYHEDDKLPIYLQRRSFEKPKRVERHVEETVRRMASQCRSLDAIEKYVTEHWAAFYERARSMVPQELEYQVSERPYLNGFSFITRSFGEISNSHYSPFGKPTNWGGRDPDLPKWHLGFGGRARITTSGDPGFSLQNIFRDTALKVGPSLDRGPAGKPGIHEVQFMAYMFLDDWKGLSDQATHDRLTGESELINNYYDNR